jgi:hypothetical protein
METETLIKTLASDVTPVRPSAARAAVLLHSLLGGLAAVVVIALTIGFRPDLDIAMRGGLFWMKVSYTGSLALIALAATLTLARPESVAPRWLWFATLPFAALAVVSIAEAASMEHDAWMKLWMGSSWRQCPALIVMLALPVGAGLTRALRQFAPTRLRLTGGVAGMAAGALAATFYCLHCPEVGAAFVLTWYTLGIVAVAGIGAIAGPRLLRW